MHGKKSLKIIFNLSTHSKSKNQNISHIYLHHTCKLRVCVLRACFHVLGCQGRLIHSRRPFIVLFKQCDSPWANILHTFIHTHTHSQLTPWSPPGMPQSSFTFLIKHECSHSCTPAPCPFISQRHAHTISAT